MSVVSRTRTERLVNLVICLLSTRRFLTAAQIAATVPGYEHDPEDPRDHEAFQRKFERDKAELRELGVPLETGTASVFDTEPGYRIARREYALPDILLEPDEAAAVGIAARLWQHAGLAAAASSGLAKLRAAGVDVDPHATLGVEPVVTVDPAFEPLTAAARDRRAVTFDYRVPEDDDPTHPPARSRGAWSAGAAGGTWSATTSTATPPAASGCPASSARCAPTAAEARSPRRPNVDLISYVARWSGPVERTTAGPPSWSGPGRAAGLRRWARRDACPARTATGWRCRYADAERLRRAGWSATAPTCACSSPPELREAVIQRLEEIVARHERVAAAVAP